MNYRFGEFSFSLRARPASLVSVLEQDLARFATDEPPLHRFTVRRDPLIGGQQIFLDRQVVHRTMSLDGVRDYILWRVSAEALGRVTDHIAIHAGAVSLRGRGVILPAPPDAGKSTLTAALVQRGFRYLSDEAALIDPRSRRLLPFPRHLWLEPGGRAALASVGSRENTWLAPERHAERPVHAYPTTGAGSPVRIRLIVFPRFQRGAGTEVRPVSRAEALIALARNSFNFGAFGGSGLRVLADVVQGASAFALTMDDLVEATGVVEDLLSSARS